MSFMAQALRLAEKGRFTCRPNPMVGCVIVKNNIIIGSGAHLKAGELHAEIHALNEAGLNAAGADIYVTLEPCSHFGRTAPCVDALIKASVKSVHIALLDPNPLVAGKGIQKLRAAGIEVFVGECAQQAYDLNKAFLYYITHKKPFVIAKWAMSLDGKISSDPSYITEKNRWITSEIARAHAHWLRAQVDAIMVGENTVKIDDPDLTVRYGYDASLYTLPRPIVLTPFGNIDHNRKLFTYGRNTLVITNEKVCPLFLAMLEQNNIEYCFISLDKNNCFNLSMILDMLATKYISTLLVEGGSYLLSSFFSAGLVHKVYTYMAPKIIGGMNSLSPIAANNFLSHKELVLSYKESVMLGSDICYISETDIMPNCYETFYKQTKISID